MPFIHIVVPAGKLTEDQKTRMRELVTDAAVEAGGDPAARAITQIIIDEVAQRTWTYAGQPVSRESLARATAAPAPRQG